MTDRKEFETKFDAWKWIHEMFPNKQWYIDHKSSEIAGYNTYRDIEEFYNYICDLGDRIEVNLKKENQTINLWIKPAQAEAVSGDTEDRAGKEKVYNRSFNEVEAVLLKGALTQMCSTFNNLDITTGQYKNTDAAMACLNLVNKIKEALER